MKREVAARCAVNFRRLCPVIGRDISEQRKAEGSFRPVMRPLSHGRQCALRHTMSRGEQGFGCPKYPAAEFRIFCAIM